MQMQISGQISVHMNIALTFWDVKLDLHQYLSSLIGTGLALLIGRHSILAYVNISHIFLVQLSESLPSAAMSHPLAMIMYFQADWQDTDVSVCFGAQDKICFH